MNILYRGKFRALARELGKYGLVPIRYKKGLYVDFATTCFVYYPSARQVQNAPEYYNDVRDFMWKHKAGQRAVLDRFFSTPGRSEGPFVVRPARHYGGRQFYIAESADEAKRIGREIGDHYYSSLFERTHEFRTIFVGGNHIVTFRKKIGDKGEDRLPQDVPWNRHYLGNVRYLTVRGSALKKAGFFRDAVGFFDRYPLDIVALDTAYNRGSEEYVVFEANLAPLVTIEHVLESMASRILELR